MNDSKQQVTPVTGKAFIRAVLGVLGVTITNH